MADTKISAFDALASSSPDDLLAIVQDSSTVTKKITVTKLVDNRLPVKASGDEIDTGTNDAKFATPKAITDSTLANIADIPVKASGAEVDTGSNDAKFVTPKALDDSGFDSKANILLAAYPIGSIYLSIVSTNPSSLFGGTWATFGAGKMLISLDTGDTDFDTAEETGCAKTKDVSHTHIRTVNATSDLTNSGGGSSQEDATVHTHTFTTASGGSASQDIMPPFIAVYMFKRTA